ncbi:MAG: methylated-DNA--[protein]-cysteine S-methyltransferase [Cyanobacteriota bacterium]|nr:methylated-DNA--[protein]-cysteine S-methyltransferase [Cyanobacteriota bacterium]
MNSRFASPETPQSNPLATGDPDTYARIAQAIAFMRQHYRHQPDLATIAQQVHLSPYHFQRLFTRWAGISPKHFLQYLTLEYAKSQIAYTRSLLDLSGNLGLSSPSRLHDLFVTLEAISPGEFKTGGSGLQIDYGIHSSPFGSCLIAKTARGICHLQFWDGAEDREQAERQLHREWVKAEIRYHPQSTQPISEQIFQPLARPTQTWVLAVKGTNFQMQVWRALLAIPSGGLTTYQDLAIAIGQPKAARAVGHALACNPVGYLIPCHRVIRQSGDLGGFRWGLERKTMMLGWEASHRQNTPVGQE